MTQPDWSARLVQVIAGEVKRHRVARNLSAQQLADRCAGLGHPIARSVLANLESGRRETISVPELFILAQALAVPPLLLLLPLGHAEEIEIAPGDPQPAGVALRWLLGEPGSQVQPPRDGEDYDGPAVITSYRTHFELVARWWRIWRSIEAIQLGRREVSDVEQKQIRADADRVRDDLKSLRVMMRAAGITPPKAPKQMHLDDR